MTGVYLSSILIRDFRTFGEFEVVVPATSGLLLITGTNGLGKSSFFDAIEWALTGKIRRFMPFVSRSGKTVIPDADYLTRNGADHDSHAVALQFSEGEPVKRSAKDTPSLATISALLANPEDGEIADLSTHLALTHFLGQAERQRFTSREPEDQWAALKGPSGVDRLELVRTRLRGRPTTLAFSRRIKAERTAIADIEKSITDWQGWQTRRERLHTAIRAGGGLTDDEIRARAAVIETEIQRIADLKPMNLLDGTTSQLLTRLSEILDDGIEKVAQRIARLEGADALIDRYEAQAALARADHPNLIRSRQQVDDTRTAKARAQQEATVASNTLTAQSERVTAAEVELARLEATRADMLRQDELAELIGAGRTEIETLKDALAKEHRLVSEADATIAANITAASEAARLQLVATQAETNFETSRELSRLLADAEGREASLKAAILAADEARNEYDTVRRRREELTNTVDATQHDLAEAERHANAIATAVASIASHIHDDEEDCPVCQAHYSAGELKLLANEAAKSGDANVAELAQRAEQLNSEVATLTQRVGELTPIFTRQTDAELQAQQARRLAVDLTETLMQALNASETDNLQHLAESRLADARSELKLAQAALVETQLAASASEERRASSIEEIDQQTTQLDATTSRVNDLLTEDQECKERLLARGVPTVSLEDITELLSVRRRDLEAARIRSVELERASDTSLATLGSLDEQLSIHEAGLASAEQAQEGAARAAEELKRQWEALELDGIPDRVSLEVARSTTSTASTDLALLSKRLKELADVNQDLLLAEELALVTEQMRKAGGDRGIEDPTKHLKTLQAQLAPARAALKLSQDAEKAVKRYTVKLGERAEAYNREVLKPLNNRILEFNAAMLSTPSASVQFKANKRVDRTDFEMQLKYSDQIDNSVLSERNVPPQVVLSEGQLAANGFSILCAASTAYRWSRWRALLLDDPLQHNDIIHTAAFVDLMRNLVELEGYQLVMSSHDRAESEFIARKFDAAGIPCTTLLLTAPSEKGVVYDPPVYNAAARGAMLNSYATNVSAT